MASLATDLRAEFPTLAGGDVAYLDAAATGQTPQAVLRAMDEYYSEFRASVHRGVYPLAARATDAFEGARHTIARFVGADPRGTVLTKNATEALNLVAHSWGEAHLREGDVVVVTELEHHSSLVPWQLACRRAGARIAGIPIDDEGELRLEVLDELLARGDVKVVVTTHVSNVTGTIVDVAEVARRAHDAGAICVVDGSQAVPQLPVDVAALGADFYAWTGHKTYGPTGVGVLHGRRELLRDMPPFLGGGHMIHSVELERSTYAEPPARFEAGTSNIAEVIGLGAACDWLDSIGGMEAVREHERAITAHALDRLGAMEGVTVHGPLDADRRGALVSFVLDGVHPHDVAEILGSRGVCVRAGHHCAQPLMRRLGIPASTRASFAVHSTPEEVDRMCDALLRVQEVFA